jgi:hypothetical protein
MDSEHFGPPDGALHGENLLCINYLDTLGLPLNAESRSLAVALCMKVLKTDPNPQRKNLYRALFGDRCQDGFAVEIPPVTGAMVTRSQKERS